MVVAVELVRNGYYSRYTLKVEPVRFAEGLNVRMRERKESGMTPGCFAWNNEVAIITDTGKAKRKAGLGGKKSRIWFPEIVANSKTLPYILKPRQQKLRILNFIWKFKGSRMARTTLKKKNKVGGLKLLDFRTYYNATATKTVWC